MTADPKREMLRYTLATLAYRGGKAIRNAPPEFAQFCTGASVRTPVQILAHLGDLLDWALSIAQGKQRWQNSPPLPWDEEVTRFFAGLQSFDDFLASDKPLNTPPERLFQGPIADALTHVGQIALLRRLCGAAVKGENYFVADVMVGRVGPEQTAAKREFD